MSMQDAVDSINHDVKAAVDDAATAYDSLIQELAKDDADLKAVLGHSGNVWSSSLKAWAQLVLAPATIAAAITNGGAYGATE